MWTAVLTLVAWPCPFVIGPCGGKTLVQGTLATLFESLGWKVYRVTETATVLLGGGVVFSRLNAAQSMSFQASILQTMMTLEDTYMKLAIEDAREGHNAIVICDRGTMDPSAYMPREDWLAILAAAQLHEHELREGRYDCVVHLLTAAYGAEQHYGSSNNQTRKEDPALARVLDDQVARAWSGHPVYDIIDNSTGFKEKKRRVAEAVLRRLGLPDSMATLNAFQGVDL